MKILIDECIDWRLARDIAGHEVMTARQMGWSTRKNGDLLALAEERFDALITVDRNLAFQQHIPKFRIAVVVLHARSNRLRDLQALIPTLVDRLPHVQSGMVTHVRLS